jgi:hypothetical protein
VVSFLKVKKITKKILLDPVTTSLLVPTFYKRQQKFIPNMDRMGIKIFFVIFHTFERYTTNGNVTTEHIVMSSVVKLTHFMGMGPGFQFFYINTKIQCYSLLGMIIVFKKERKRRERYECNVNLKPDENT